MMRIILVDLPTTKGATRQVNALLSSVGSSAICLWAQPAYEVRGGYRFRAVVDWPDDSQEGDT